MTDEKNKELLTEQEVWDVIAFARALSGGIYGNYLTPDLISSMMKDITLNPSVATEANIATALNSPKESEANLQAYSQDFEIRSMVYKRLLSYLGNMLSFDITYTSNAKLEEYKTPKYRKDSDAVENFLDRFDYKKELSIAVKEMLRNDAYFGCIRDVGSKIILQELPSDYCKITGRWEGGFLFSFNMYWFLRPGVDINMYPDFFKKKYKEIWQSPNANKNYIPSLPPEFRDKSVWIYWVDVPADLGVCFKLSPELATRVPYFTPLFSDLVLQSQMRNLQKNASIAAASKIIIGQVPLLNKDIKATIRDSFAISPDLLGKFMALVKSALSDTVKFASAPLEDIQGISFDSENELYDSYLKTTLATSGINTNLIFTSDVKQNSIETQLSLNTDEQMMTALYDQFNLFMDYHGNKYTKTFRFNFYFEGTDFFLNRQQRLDTVMTFFNQGIVLPQKMAAAIGVKPSQFRKYMEEAKATGFMEMLTPPSLEQQKVMAEINAKTQEKQAEINAENQAKLQKQNQDANVNPSASRGRPTKKTSEISEEGLTTRDQAANVGRGGKTPTK